MARSSSDITPQSITAASFKTVKKGYDPAEVRNFLSTVAGRMQQVQADAEAMEARARAALAKLHASDRAPDVPLVSEAETISRTLLLAQRTADETIEQARREAEKMIVDAEAEARAAHADAWEEAQSEVEALRARRDFLAGDVEELERFLAAQRLRLGEVAERLMGFVAAPIEGLGLGTLPVLSAVDSPAVLTTPQPEAEAEPDRYEAPVVIDTDVAVETEPESEQLVLGDTDDSTPPSGTGLRFRDGV
jgi:DivIVA domain-containing protein